MACMHSKNISNSNTTSLPFLLMDELKMADLKNKIDSKDAAAQNTFALIISEANKALKNPLYSVTFLKDSLPPSGDKRDYMSMGPYWWPDPNKPGGKPYIRRDGETNPERDKLRDHDQLYDMSRDVQKLALAYYFSKNENYAARINEILKVWFVDNATRMNPHLNYGQGIPGITQGRGIGIIETRVLTNIPDALALIKRSSSLKPSIVTAVKEWFVLYTDWLINSPIGLEEQKAKNNHGTYYDVQVIDFALFTGNIPLAKKIINQISKARIDTQFTTEGAQPLEMERTRSWSYSAMNVLGWARLAALAEKAGVDIWHYESAQGKSLYKTLKWFAPYLIENKKWENTQITSVSNDELFAAYSLAADKYKDDYFKTIKHGFKEYDWNKVW